MAEWVKKNFDWRHVKNGCRTTEGKRPTDKNASPKFVRDIIISEHSPIRRAWGTVRLEGIPYWVAMHFVRHHEGALPLVSTQREDRTGNDRRKLPQDAPVNLEMDLNAQALINMAKVRLCYKASPETRACMEEIKALVREEAPELARAMVPSCVYRCGCPEMGGCGYFAGFAQWACGNGYDLADINDRYNAYDSYKYGNDKEE